MIHAIVWSFVTYRKQVAWDRYRHRVLGIGRYRLGIGIAKKCFDTSTDTAHTSHLCEGNNRLLFWLHTSKKEAACLCL